jgi:hypothetical protein
MKLNSLYLLGLFFSTMFFSSCEYFEPPLTAGWNCNGGCCEWVEQNGTYSNLLDCEDACNWFPLVDYMVWTDVDLGCFPIEVKMTQDGGYTKTSYLTGRSLGGTPECGDVGPANFILEPDFYNMEATCSNGMKWTKRIYVPKVCCSGVKLN